MHSTALLVLRWRGYAHALRVRRWRTVGRTAGLAFLALCWSIAIAAAVGTMLSASFLSAAQAPEAQRLIETFALSIAITGVLTLALFIDHGTAAALLAPHVDRLLVAPVDPRRIVRATMLANLPYAVAIVVPGMVACAVVTGQSSAAAEPGSYIVAAVLCVALGVFAMSLSLLLATTIARLLPRRRAIAVLETTAAVAASLLGLAMLWGGGGARVLASLDQLRLHPHDAPSLFVRALLWSPAGWAAHALDATAHGDGATCAIGLGAVIALSALTAWAAQESGAALYAHGWTAQEAAIASHRRATRHAWPRGRVWSLLYKDWLLARRTPPMLWGWISVLLYFALAAYFSRDVATMRALSPRLASIWIGYDIGARMLSLDRAAFWSVFVAPVRAGDIVREKMLGAWCVAVPTAALGSSIVAAMRGADLAHALREGATGASLAIAGVACGLIVGAFFTNFGWRRRAHMLTSLGRWMFVLAFLVPFGLIFALILAGATWAVGPLGSLVVAAVCCAIAWPVTTARIARLQWQRSDPEA